MTRILLDVDGVVADFVGSFRAEAQKLYEHDLANGLGAEWAEYATSTGKPTDWDLRKSLGLTTAQESRVWEAVCKPGFATTLETLPKAKEAVLLFKKLGLDVVFLTAPCPGSPTWAYDRKQWLEQHFGTPVRVISTHEKECVYGDIFVDDKLANIEVWKAAWPDGLAIHYREPLHWGYVMGQVLLHLAK